MRSNRIHPTALISDSAKIGENVTVGPYVVIRGDVTLERDCIVDSFAVLGSDFTKTVIGERCHIYPGSVVGEVPQDLKYKGEKTQIIVGSDCAFREYSTVHAGTPAGGEVTEIGSHGLFMAYVHIAHDCKIGDHVVIANSCQLAGHVQIDDHVKVGGVCCFNQFVRLGKHSYVAGDSAVNKDVVPFSIAQGKYAVMRAANQIGMERANYSKQDIDSIRKAIRIITKGGLTIEESLDKIRKECRESDALSELTHFIQSSQRGIAL